MFLKTQYGTKNFQSYYSDIRMLGKHFKIMSTENTNVFRHYTVCNAMQPEFYEKLNRTLLASNESEKEKSVNGLT